MAGLKEDLLEAAALAEGLASKLHLERNLAAITEARAFAARLRLHASSVEERERAQAVKDYEGKLARAVEMLRVLEWSDMRPLSATRRCPACFNAIDLGHVDGCVLAAFLFLASTPETP